MRSGRRKLRLHRLRRHRRRSPRARPVGRDRSNPSYLWTTSLDFSYRIPCCYEKQLDLKRVAEHAGLSEEDVIRLHSDSVYTVYAIGFCPGFPYLGYLPPELSGVPRLTSPRLKVEAGSVGLTGRQTGIYTEARPGGWNVVGRTPLQLVDVADGYFPLRTGDRVRFVPVGAAEHRRLLGQRLT